MSKRVKSASTGVPQRTLSLRLELDHAQRELFAEVIEHYNLLWADVVDWCKSNESTNRTRLQKEMYHELREMYPDLPSQFVSIALRDGAGAVKSWNSNNPKRKWRLKGVRKASSLNYDLRVMSLRGNLLSLGSFAGEPRFRTLIDVPEWFSNRYPEAKINAAKLILHKDGKTSINLIFRVKNSDPRDDGELVGIDRGLKSLVVTSRGGEIKSARIMGVKRKYAHNRSTLQSKGTRSAKRRLRAMSGREERFVRDMNHTISKNLANQPNVSGYVLEDLTGISKNKQKSRKRLGKKMRTWVSNWSYFQLESFIEYKCARNGIAVHYVSPAYTSQRCNRCGYVDRKNRKAAHFDCLRCQHSTNADLNAAKNIRDKYILSAVDGGAGHQSFAPMDGGSECVIIPHGNDDSSDTQPHVQAATLVVVGN